MGPLSLRLKRFRLGAMTLFQDDPFKPARDSPLYQQLYSHVRRAILTGTLKGDTKLPSTRTLADELGVSRNTVLNAYEQLLAEGYLESSSGSGTYVARVLPDHLLRTPRPQPDTIEQPPSHLPQFSRHAQLQLSAPRQFTAIPSREGIVPPFSPATPALDAFPHEVWSQLVTRQAKRRSARDYYYALGGYAPLREAIAAHVTFSRQVRCTAEQVIIVSGSQGGLDLSARLFLDSGDAVWLEDPGYLGARGAFLGVGAKIIPVPLDKEGLVVETGVKRAPNAKLAFVTPSHQFPLGMTMSVRRRLALLEWAKEANAYILEDDYDSEFRYSGRPLASLQGLDEAEHVIYIGTFSKVLFPSLRLGYLIVPPSLTQAFLTVQHSVDIHNPFLEQAVLTDFIVEGHFARHLRRMRKLYAERRLMLLETLRDLPLDIESPEAGIHCVAWLPEGVDDEAFVQKAKSYGLDLWPVSLFSIERLPRQGIILVYGGLSKDSMEEGARLLAKVLREL